MKKIFLKTTFCAALLNGFVTTVQAQKNDEMLKNSKFAPPATKIDGKNLEWKDTDFFLHKKTDISYVISNDEMNLYLIIKSKDVTNNAKILAGGITFSVNTDKKKNLKESMSLTYPVVNQVSTSSSQVVVVSSPTRTGFKDPGRDSVIAARQKRNLERAKEIKISGFKNTTDTLISIYNEQGIKVFANIEKDHSFFYELAIPLEALGISVKQPIAFAYNIKINGLQLPGLGNTEVVVGSLGGGSGNTGGSTEFQEMTSTTDFWAEYKLANR